MTQSVNHSWEDVYKQNIDKIIGICFRYVQNKEIAEDLAQDSFLIAIDRFESFKATGALEAWLRRIAINESLQYLRNIKNKETIKVDSELHLAQFLKVHENSDQEDDIKTEYTIDFIFQAINELPEHHRLVFNLYVLDKHSHLEIAKILNISPGTSKSHLARARKSIRNNLYKNARDKFKETKKQSLVFLFLIKFNFINIDKISQRYFLDLKFKPAKDLKIDTELYKEIKFTLSQSVIKKYTTLKLIGISIFIGISIVLITINGIGKKVSIKNDMVSFKQGKETFSNTFSPSYLEMKEFMFIGIPSFDSTAATISDFCIIPNKQLNKPTGMRNFKLKGLMLIAASGIMCDSIGQTSSHHNGGLNTNKDMVNQVVLKNEISQRSNVKNENSKTYYFIKWSADISIYDQDSLFLSSSKIKENYPRLELSNSSDFEIQYKVNIDTIKSIDENTKQMVVQVVDKVDTLKGKYYESVLALSDRKSTYSKTEKVLNLKFDSGETIRYEMIDKKDRLILVKK